MGIDSSAKIKCGGCAKNLLLLRFPESGQRKYRESLAQHQKNPKIPIRYPLCQKCHVGNRHELTCCMCGTTKRLEGFSKAQRKKPDDAHCLDCQQEKDDREPNHEDEVKEILLMEQLKEQSRTGSTSGRSTLSSFSGSANQSSVFDQDNQSETSTNPRENIYLGNEPPIFKQSSVASFSTVSGRTSPSPFAKQNAVQKLPEMKVHEQWLREQRRQKDQGEQLTYSADDDDDDGDDDFPY